MAVKINALKRTNKNIKSDIMLAIVMVNIPLLIVITYFFIQTNRTMQEKYVKTLDYNTREIQSKIDDIISSIYNVSDTFAFDQRVLAELDKVYGENKKIEKRAAILRIRNKLFEGYNLLLKNEQIAAIYSRNSGVVELFNMIDPNCDSQEVIDRLSNMNIGDKTRLSKFFWYPLQENFLKESKYNDLRMDKVVIGSRKIFSNMKAGYPYIHIFTLKESTLYDKYELIANQLEGEVYIINGEGDLLSSSNEAAVMNGRMDDRLRNKVLSSIENNFVYTVNDVKYLVNFSYSDVNDWRTVLLVPSKNAVRDVNELYVKLAWLIAIATCSYVIILLLFYTKFTKPISMLNKSMKEVYNGNLNAYVSINNNNEIGRMIQYYNNMLDSINYNINEKLLMEKKKKKLEMDVLMNQINPHFLYNTLETIVWKCGEANRPDIGRIAAHLGRMYRLSISDGNLMVKVSLEIEHVMAYINIQKVRYEDSFQFELRADINRLRDLYTLKLILQPVVENSFLYGMEDLDHTMKVRMTVRIYDDFIKIIVVDNGVGMSKERLAEVRRQIVYGKAKEIDEQKLVRKSTGVGLHNVYARLKLYFSIDNGVKVYSKKGFGTMSVITIPNLDYKIYDK